MPSVGCVTTKGRLGCFQTLAIMSKHPGASCCVVLSVQPILAENWGNCRSCGVSEEMPSSLPAAASPTPSSPLLCPGRVLEFGHSNHFLGNRD